MRHEESRGNEIEARRLQRDSKGFPMGGEGLVRVGLRVGPQRRGDGTAALKAYQAVLEKTPAEQRPLRS